LILNRTQRHLELASGVNGEKNKPAKHCDLKSHPQHQPTPRLVIFTDRIGCIDTDADNL
jgi:hypothetical protein